MRTVAIIGAGAAGMMAALTAAEDSGNRVVLLERQARAGRKLMATGNGRCNLTNTGASAAGYHGEDPSFAAFALGAFPPGAALEFFRGLGLVTTEEYGGRVFPLSNSANSVVDVLRYALAHAGVELRPGQPVTGIRRDRGGFSVAAGESCFSAGAVIVACGGAAGERLGGVKDGYELLKALGHSRTAIYPALTPITTDPAYPRALKGIRADARLTVFASGRAAGESEGEILFTETGVSGPAAFAVSRTVAAGGAESLSIDLLRGFGAGEVRELLRARRAAMPELPAGELLTGALHNRLGRVLVRYSGVSGDTTLGELSDGQLEGVAAACKGFALPVRGVEGFAGAQVTAGGVRTGEFDPKTMGSRLVPGLYACGEVLDIDGDCGGYNLQWAWASGRLAGRLL